MVMALEDKRERKLRLQREAQKRYRERHPERVKELRRASYVRNGPPVKDAEVEYMRHILRRYGLTKDEYERLLNAQDGVCKVCREPKSYRLYVDHCHTTGKVRGLLCSGCNVAVGWYERLGDAARRYLEEC